MPVSGWRMGSNNVMYDYIVDRWPKKPFMPKIVTDDVLQMKKAQVKPKARKKKGK